MSDIESSKKGCIMKKIFTVLMCCFFVASASCKESREQHSKKAEDLHTIAIDIRINCPMSSEFKDFLESVPHPGHYESQVDEWKASFVNNMTQLIKLVESGNFETGAWWSVHTNTNTP
jgi:hypothetical protein